MTRAALAAGLLLLAAACSGSHHLASSAARPDRVIEAGELSPDRLWSLAYTRKHGYGHLDITERATGRTFRMYRSNDGCCTEITWQRPHLLIFVDDYKTLTLDPATKRVTRIAHFSNYVVSADGRWVAGWADCGGHCAESVAVVPITGGRCRAVPRRVDQDDNALGFSRTGDVLIGRRYFDVKDGEPVRNGFPTRFHTVTVPLAQLRPTATC
jgi:hypothetical protein